MKDIKELKIVEINISAIHKIVTEGKPTAKRLKELKEEVINYAEVYDNIVLEGLSEVIKNKHGQKQSIELKLSQGYLRTRLPEVTKEFKVLIGQAIRS